MATLPAKPQLDDDRYDLTLLPWMDAVELVTPISTGTVHFVGDLHVGLSGTDTRHATALADFIALNGSIDYRVYLGDLQETPADAGQRSGVKALIGAAGTRNTYDLVLGNHDIGSGDTGDEVMAEYGYASRNWTRDLPFVRLIGITPDTIATTGTGWLTFSSDDLAYLDAALGSTDKRCVICFHAPLGGTTTAQFTSLDVDFRAHPDAALRAILRAHPNAYMWVSGHTHAATSDTGILRSVNLGGGRSILALNCSAIAYVGGVSVASSVLYSPVVTFEPTRVVVRWRDHATGTWATVQGDIEHELPANPDAVPDINAILDPDGSVGLSGALSPTVGAGVTSTSGLMGNAWSMPAGGDGVQIANSGKLPSSEGSFAFWANLTTGIGADTRCFYAGSGTSVLGIRPREGSSDVQMLCSQLNAGFVFCAVSTQIVGNGWHLIYGEYGRGTIGLAVDLGAVSTAAADPGFATIAGNLNIGRGLSAGSSVAGSFESFGAFSRKLTDDERAHLYYRRVAWTLDMFA